MDDIVDFRGLTLEVPGLEETECLDCRLTWETVEQQKSNLDRMTAAHEFRRNTVRFEQGLLTSAEVARTLELLELNRVQAAELFGGGPNAFAKYIRGDVLQSVAMDRLLRLTLAFGHHAVNVLRNRERQPLELGSAYPVTSKENAAFSVGNGAPTSMKSFSSSWQ